MTRFGDAVRRLRDGLDMSQEELAAKAEISRATIQNIEDADEDKLQGGTRRKLAAALGITTARLEEEWKGEHLTLRLPADLVGQIQARATLEKKDVADWLRELVDAKNLSRVKANVKSPRELTILHSDISESEQPSEAEQRGSADRKSH